MTIEDDETLRMYVEESLEHLEDIENDFLEIEGAGADIDEGMVNKVFRAAHSIKGGAGFMGLTNIKELAHWMENVLGMIRGRELVPNAESVNILLLAADELRNLINNVGASNDADISGHIDSLNAIVEGHATQKQEDTSTERIDISFPDARCVFTVAEEEISSVRKEGKYIYLVEIDLIRYADVKKKTPAGLVDEIAKCGTILESRPAVDEIGMIEKGTLPEQLCVQMLFASILDADSITGVFEIEEKDIFEFAEDLSVRSIVETGAFKKDDVRPAAEEPAIDAASESARIEEKPVKKPEKKAVPAAQQIASETSLRVHVSLLDSLMNLAGELVLSRNQLLQSLSSDANQASETAGQRIDMITSELQEAIMLTRMQAIGNVFNKFPRVVRDLSMSLGKNVELTLEGKDVELDKTIIEAISDPLTHLVRNSVDHGIEPPDERNKAGKKPTGRVLLKAYHKAGQINIEITDDGKGLDGDKLAAAAVAKGILTQDRARAMSEKEKVNLIFFPGFSTAKKVTDVSGRGVGMDVVKTNLDKLGGQTDIDSESGKGTTIRIKLPLTLAIIPSQIILAGKERYAVPQVNLEELLRIPADQVKQRIERVGNAEVVRLRGNLLPLIRLADVIGIERIYHDSAEAKEKPDSRKNIADRRSRKSPLFNEIPQDDIEDTDSTDRPLDHSQLPRSGQDRRYHADSSLNIAVVSSGATKYGLVVDNLLDSEEIVVKPLGRDFKHCKGYAGATIMGDGKVALILDVANLAQMAGLTSVEGSDRAAELATEMNENISAGKDRQSLLVFKSAEDEQFAVPLNHVKRIEKIKTADMEEVGGKRVIQYRGGSLPLFAIDDVAHVKPVADKEDLLVIVFVIAHKEAGLLATSPVDALEISIAVDDSIVKQPGIMGSAIIGGQTTLLVDVFDMVQTLSPEWFSEHKDAVGTSGDERGTILIAEDSHFFRRQVKAFIESEGYNVIEAEDGMIAWDLLQEHGDEISLVITDIEMPNLDGFGLTEKIKGDERYSHLPVIAVTTLAGDEDIARGKAVGVDDYQIKLERERLLESIRGFLNR